MGRVIFVVIVLMGVVVRDTVLRVAVLDCCVEYYCVKGCGCGGYCEGGGLCKESDEWCLLVD